MHDVTEQVKLLQLFQMYWLQLYLNLNKRTSERSFFKAALRWVRNTGEASGLKQAPGTTPGEPSTSPSWSGWATETSLFRFPEGGPLVRAVRSTSGYAPPSRFSSARALLFSITEIYFQILILFSSYAFLKRAFCITKLCEHNLTPKSWSLAWPRAVNALGADIRERTEHSELQAVLFLGCQREQQHSGSH